MILVTGGAGFIGSNFVRDWLARSDEPVLNLDALTYAGHPDNLAAVRDDPRHLFVHGDIRDRALLDALLASHRPRAVLHLAAESHVDRSIAGPAAFIGSNVVGTGVLLEAVLAHWRTLPAPDREAFRFLHVSTDEVYGDLPADAPPADEDHPYAPGSPYSASKAAADHLVQAWHRTYGLPVLTTHSSNNLGPRQFAEKLVPRMIAQALAGQPLPLYGDGLQQRDWLDVADHCAALRRVLEAGRPGRRYNVGSGHSRSNLALVQALCTLLDQLRPDPAGPHARLIGFVADRPGHDRRYALDTRRIRTELGWAPQVPFETALARTLRWYLDHPERLAAAPPAGP
jgi:dTDP-glucose 4,6-dehydratase